MFCSKCGFKNKEGTAFCQQCGNDLRATEAHFQGAQSSFQPSNTTFRKPTVRSSNHALNTVKGIVASPLFITSIILFSATLFFDFISLIAGKYGVFGFIDSIADKFGLGYEINELLSTVRGFSSVMSFFKMIPTIIIAVGLWMIFSTAINRNSDGMKTSGFTMIKVINIIRLVYICVWLGVVEIIFIIAMIQSSKSYSTLAGISDTTSSIASVGIGVLLLLDLLIIAGFVIAILYYAKIISSINTVKRTINSGNADDKVSRYVAVITFILSGFTLLSVFFSSGALSVLSTLCSAASTVCFGILIFKYRDAMRSQLNNSNQ